MPRARTNYIAEARWNDPKKVDYRYDAVIAPYQSFFKPSIPPDKQYWTLCGAHFNEDGPITTGSEFLQLTQELVTPQQFNGVDREESIISRNQEIHPDAVWHHGDLQEVIRTTILANAFNPAIVHFDGINETQIAAEYASGLFRMFDGFVPSQMLFIVSLPLRNPYRFDTVRHGNEFVEELLKYYEPCRHWRLLDTYYWYAGSGTRSNTVMGSFAWVKKQHDPENIEHGAFQFTANFSEIQEWVSQLTAP